MRHKDDEIEGLWARKAMESGFRDGEVSDE
jgi:hypothetical protein